MRQETLFVWIDIGRVLAAWGLTQTLLGSHYYLKMFFNISIKISHHHDICRFHDKYWTEVQICRGDNTIIAHCKDDFQLSNLLGEDFGCGQQS